jgi:hypothetical protein
MTTLRQQRAENNIKNEVANNRERKPLLPGEKNSSLPIDLDEKIHKTTDLGLNDMPADIVRHIAGFFGQRERDALQITSRHFYGSTPCNYTLDSIKKVIKIVVDSFYATDGTQMFTFGVTRNYCRVMYENILSCVVFSSCVCDDRLEVLPLLPCFLAIETCTAGCGLALLLPYALGCVSYACVRDVKVEIGRCQIQRPLIPENGYVGLLLPPLKSTLSSPPLQQQMQDDPQEGDEENPTSTFGR